MEDFGVTMKIMRLNGDLNRYITRDKSLTETRRERVSRISRRTRANRKFEKLVKDDISR